MSPGPCKEGADSEIGEESKAGINQGGARIQDKGQRWVKAKGNVWAWRKGSAMVDVEQRQRQTKAKTDSLFCVSVTSLSSRHWSWLQKRSALTSDESVFTSPVILLQTVG